MISWAGDGRSAGPPAYFDAAATTPVDDRVAALVMRGMVEEFGNAGSRTHDYGMQAKRLSESAREQLAAVVGAEAGDVIFTSGATEANNLALLGLAEHGRAVGRTHIITTAIEHKAVLEPAQMLAQNGFKVDFVPPGLDGAVRVDDVLEHVLPETLLVSVMHVNNETGVRQPLAAIADALPEHVFLHSDAAQGFGKELEDLRNPRIDLVSASGHKLFAPKGVGALIARRRDRRRPPLTPLMYGGGQERGFRPGTLPVPLVAGFGLAAQIACVENLQRRAACLLVREALLNELADLEPVMNGDPDLSVPHIVNVSIPGLDGEAAILALRDVVAVSNGSACTSARYEPSHVLEAMGVADEIARGAIRFSWTHGATPADVAGISRSLRRAI
jgi:cysteine desulfurase